MQKRIYSLILALLFSMSTVGSVLADETEMVIGKAGEAEVVELTNSSVVKDEESEKLNERLAKITVIVKQKLGIDDHYTGFYGDYEGGSVSAWRLNWSCEEKGETVTVNADEDGKILYYSYKNNSVYNSYSSNSEFAPIFPKVSRLEAKKAAIDFVSSILEDGESVSFKENSEILSAKDVRRYSFSSNLFINGVESPITISVSVQTSDLKVTSFSRSDRYTAYVGDIADKAVVSDDVAGEKLSTTPDMELKYILEYDENDTEKKNPKAVLKYIPKLTGDYIVDAVTGDLINMDDIYKEANTYLKYESGMIESESAADSTATNAGGLSSVEVEGIEKLEGVMTKQQLDDKIRNLSEFGISEKYSLGMIEYSLNNETGDVTCRIRYNCPVENILALKDLENITGKVIIKSFILDGKTGEISKVYTSYPYLGSKNTIKAVISNSNEIAKEFLSKYEAEKISVIDKLSETITENENTIPRVRYQYAQKQNDYFLESNYINVEVNLLDGVIDAYSKSWVDDVDFESADGIISKEDAIKAYCNAHEIKLSYINYPIKLDVNVPEHRVYIDFGEKYIYTLKLSYSYYTDKNIRAILAKTGEVITNEYVDYNKVSVYDDIENSYAKYMIKELANYGIGFAGTKFEPEKKLTQIDMIKFILSATGDKYIIRNNEIDNIYQRAYDLGILDERERNPDKEITKAELAKTLIYISDYGKMGYARDIFVCGYADDTEISDEYYGYVAIAKALGVVKGAEDGNFYPNKVVTREDAAAMMYGFMDRKVR